MRCIRQGLCCPTKSARLLASAGRGPRGAEASGRWGAGGTLPETPEQKYRCRVGREVSHPGPSPDPDKEISTIRLFHRCGSWLYVATTFTSSGDMLSNVSALDMVLF